MTKIKCSKGKCKLVPTKARQYGKGLTSRPTYYLIPVKSSNKVRKIKNQQGYGKSGSRKSACKKKAPKSQKKIKVTKE